MLNAFCRVAPSLRFSVFAILFAGTFFLASVFSSRTGIDVQARLFFDPFFIRICSPCKGRALVAENQSKEKPASGASLPR